MTKSTKYETKLLKDFNQAITKLVKSNTKLTRKRARSHFRAMTKVMLNTFRAIRADGTLTEVPSTIVCVCPLCDSAIRYWSSLLSHLSKYHDIEVVQVRGLVRNKRSGRTRETMIHKCFGCFKPCAGLNGLTKHLAHVQRNGGWKDHVTQAAMRAAFAQPKGTNP